MNWQGYAVLAFAVFVLYVMWRVFRQPAGGVGVPRMGANDFAAQLTKQRLVWNNGQPYFVEHAPVGEANHTSFMIIPGSKAGTVAFFSKGNFDLTTPEYQAHLRQEIADLGFEIEE